MQITESPNIFVDFCFNGKMHTATSFTPNKKESIEIDPMATAHWTIKSYLVDNHLITNESLPVIVQKVTMKYDGHKFPKQNFLKIER